MDKLIEKRYQNIGMHIYQDLQTGDLVRVHTIASQKLPELIHNAFLRRANELSRLKHDGLTRLVNYGFDDKNNCYFLVYESATGRTLEKQLQAPDRSTEWALDILLEIADILIFLHNNHFHHGSLNHGNIVLDMQGELPLKIDDPALESFRSLISSKPIENPDWLRTDLGQLGDLASVLLSRNLSPTESQIRNLLPSLPPTLRVFIQRAYLNKESEQYSSIYEAQRDLLKVKSECQTTTTYYLVPARKVVEALFDFGCIEKEEFYLAADLINSDLSQERCGRIDDSTISTQHQEGRQENYLITTVRFRLRCAPWADAPDRLLAIINVEIPSGTGLAEDREKGLPIQDVLRVETSKQKVPQVAKITPLLDRLSEHFYRSEQIKKQRITQKSSIEDWERVLALQKRLLDQIKLTYTDWELTDGGASILVTLMDENAFLNITYEQRLMMSAVNSEHRSIIVGYYEELSGSSLKISLSSEVNIEQIARQGEITLDNIQVRSILYRQEDGLRRLRYGESLNPNLLELISHPTQITLEEGNEVAFLDSDLDEAQQLAVRRACAARDIFLIHGPPGTGKTRTIVEIVRQAINVRGPSPKILISSQSNVAVNHALTTLLELQPGLREHTVRIGREEKAGETADLMITPQIKLWLDKVGKKSEDFLVQERKKFQQPQLAECLVALDDYINCKNEITTIETQLNQQEAALQETLQDINTMQELLHRARNLRQGTASLLQAISEKDVTLRQLLQNFDIGYLGWAEKFLELARRAARLSERRLELIETIQTLQEDISNRQKRQNSNIQFVRYTLLEHYGVDLVTYEGQRKYITENLTAQLEAARQLGRINEISQHWCQRLRQHPDDFTGAYLQRCQIIGATCIGVAARGEVSEVEFDWVIIDEAGRSTHPELIVPMVRGRKIILVGDHKQLPPIIDQELDNNTLEDIGVKHSDLETSLFQELIEPAPAKAILQVQYRMAPAIGELVSQCFYESRLQHGENVILIQHGLSFARTPVLWIDTSKVKNHQERQEGTSFTNQREAEITIAILGQIKDELARLGANKSVGVIAGYSAQKRRLIREASNHQYKPYIMLEIDTVDAYQGREMDIIIYNVVRSNPNRIIGFLQDERRLNVALSRARELLIIIGDRETAEFAHTGRGDNPFHTVIQHIKNHPEECLIKDATL